MNFELIDNFMQVGVMFVAAVADIIFETVSSFV